MELYPLTFEPVFRSYIWGGRRLGEVLDKPIGEAPRYAESWEVVDHGADQSVVASGPLAGKSLRQLIELYGEKLLGRRSVAKSSSANPAQAGTSFPLLLKYLDCNRVLSVQVHPDDAYGARMNPPDLGKTEAWYVIAAEPNSVIYAGLAAGVDREAFATAIRTSHVEEVLHKIVAQPGQCIFIPAGTVHALGAGILVAEIQQSSDTTFRIFDWDRLDDAGQPRPLHIEQALEVTNYEAGPVSPQLPLPLGDDGQRLVACDKFFLDRYAGVQPVTIQAAAEFRILTVVQGGGTLCWLNETGRPESLKLPLGQTVLLPATCPSVEFVPYGGGATLLVMGPPQQ
ncbi:type I phosphomannose isomerase catalytic subunit [Planctomycetaceae bacterium SH139]